MATIPLQFSSGGTERFLAIFKRNDQSTIGARHMQPVGYIHATQFMQNCKFIPADCSELMAQAFVLAWLPLEQLPFIRQAITENAAYMDALNKTDRVCLDESLLIGKTDGVDVKSGSIITPVSLTDKTSIFKAVKMAAATEDLLTDLKAITAGDYTYGAGGTYDYLLQSAAYADLGGLTGNLSLVQMTILTETAGSTMGAALNGFAFSDDGGKFADTISVNATAVALNGVGGAAGVVNYTNDNSVRDATVLTVARYFLIVNATVAHTINVNACRYDGASKANAGGVYVSNATAKLLMKDIICKNMPGNCFRLGVAQNAASVYENLVADNGASGFVTANLANTIRNSVIINCTNNWTNNTNSVSLNCATDKVAVGAATDTNPQVSLVVADEFINTTITDLVDGYRLKSATSIKLKSNGAAPGIAANTTDIFGRSRPDGAAGYSIGVAERAIPTITGVVPNKGQTGGKTKILISGINHIPDGATNASTTVGGNPATGASSTATGTSCITPSGKAGRATVGITNSDGESASLAGGYLYQKKGTYIGVGVAVSLSL